MAAQDQALRINSIKGKADRVSHPYVKCFHKTSTAYDDMIELV